jgi:hypothetical protein
MGVGPLRGWAAVSHGLVSQKARTKSLSSARVEFIFDF